MSIAVVEVNNSGDVFEIVVNPTTDASVIIAQAVDHAVIIVEPNGQAAAGGATWGVNIDGDITQQIDLIDYLSNMSSGIEDDISFVQQFVLNYGYEAGEDIPAYTLVVPDSPQKIFKADSNNPNHFGKIIGITIIGDIATGDQGTVVYGGRISNGAWNWTPGDILFLNGQGISTTPPDEGSSVFSQQIGVADSPGTIILRIQPAILF